MEIVARNVTKVYGSRVALDNVSLVIESGVIASILGPNGAGKTTLLRALSGSLRVNRGLIRIGNVDVVKNPLEARRISGFMAETHMLFPDLTAMENLLFVARLHGLDRSRAVESIRRLAEAFDVAELLGRKYGRLSKGQKRRIDLISALVHDPPVVFLDEPTGGLDPVSSVWLRSMMRRLASEGRLVVTSTHFIGEAFHISDKIVVLSGGRVIAEGPPGRLRRMFSGRDSTVIAEATVDPDLLAARLRSLGLRASSVEGRVVIVGSSGEAVEKLVLAVRELGGRLVDVTVKELSWEEVFRRIVEAGESGACPCSCSGGVS